MFIENTHMLKMRYSFCLFEFKIVFSWLQKCICVHSLNVALQVSLIVQNSGRVYTAIAAGVSYIRTFADRRIFTLTVHFFHSENVKKPCKILGHVSVLMLQLYTSFQNEIPNVLSILLFG